VNYGLNGFRTSLHGTVRSFYTSAVVELSVLAFEVAKNVAAPCRAISTTKKIFIEAK
jgi:hypothetical protein